MRSDQIILIVLGVLAVVGIGYVAIGKDECRDLREDHLNAASSIKVSIATRSVLGDDHAEAQELMEQDAWSDFETSLEQLYAKCGERRAKSATREAQAIIGGWSTPD
tara:strand:+ start:1097 stop:1417 length:321 start_codon:yes stop_codon:yes gene_type:complete